MLNQDKKMAPSDRSNGGFHLAHAFLWAALMIASAVVLRATAPGASDWLVTVVLIPGWWASEQILRRALRRRLTQEA